MSEKMSAENRAKTLERFLDKFPWSGFAHGALVKCITAAEEAAYADGQREMRERIAKNFKARCRANGVHPSRQGYPGYFCTWCEIVEEINALPISEGKES